MDFFRMKRFRKLGKNKRQENSDAENNQSPPEESKEEISDSLAKETVADPNAEAEGEDDDDDDFITNEVKRRLKELRKNAFMVLIPEEEKFPEEEEEEEEEEETSSSEWKESEVEDGYPWCGFHTLYDKYCERMLFFDKMIAQQLQEAGSQIIQSQSPKSASKKLVTTLKNLSFKRRDEFQGDREHLQQTQEEDPYQNLETAYVAQVALSWEALHCQYIQLIRRILALPENPTSYCYAAQAFQQFQVLLQRFIENEPFEQGSRTEIYARSRISMPKLLQVPSFQGTDHVEMKPDSFDPPILASDLVNVMEDSILTFRQFLKMDKKKSGGSLTFFVGHDQVTSSLQLVQSSLDKKEIKVKEFSKKKKGWKKKSVPSTIEEMELLFALIDIKVISRVLKMERISKEQLLWCEEKMSKLDFAENRLRRNASPILFPC